MKIRQFFSFQFGFPGSLSNLNFIRLILFFCLISSFGSSSTKIPNFSLPHSLSLTISVYFLSLSLSLTWVPTRKQESFIVFHWMYTLMFERDRKWWKVMEREREREREIGDVCEGESVYPWVGSSCLSECKLKCENGRKREREKEGERRSLLSSAIEFSLLQNWKE